MPAGSRQAMGWSWPSCATPGSPATQLAVTARLQRYLDVGISHFIFALGYPFDLTPLRLFQEKVLPSLS